MILTERFKIKIDPMSEIKISNTTFEYKANKFLIG